ncbi:ferritin family protein [Acidobacteriota bacterium]
MSYEFNADEVFGMAEQIERNGKEFYRAAAESVDDPENRDLLSHLADMEVQHEEIFKSLRKELSTSETEETTFDAAGEAGQYLKAFADSHVFYKKEIDVTTLEKIFRAAIQAEKDSIVFYLGLKDAISLSHGKEQLNKIIKEEMGHLKILNTELARLKD